MAGHTLIGASARDRYMQAAQSEMAKFERQEIEFRKKDRAERAAALRIPTDDEIHDKQQMR